MSTAHQNRTWPQIPDAFEYRNSSKLPPEAAAAQREIVLANKNKPLNQQQLQLVYGTMLGDGHLTPRGAYVATQSYAFREYHWAKYTILSDYVYGVPSKQQKRGTDFWSVKFWTAATPELASLRQLWYPDGHKRVNREILQTIDELGFLDCVMWWICDDGTRWGPKYSPTLSLCTHAFPQSDVELLSNWLMEHGYRSSIREQTQYRKPLYTLMFATESAVRLMRKLTPLVHPTMLYKVAVTGRNDTEICLFCKQPFQLKTLRRRTDLAWFPCCDNPACKSAKKKFMRQRELSKPGAKAKRQQAKREYVQRNKAAIYAKNAEWARNNPDKVREIWRRADAKKRRKQQEAMPPCVICGKQIKLERGMKHTRTACGGCQPELLRRRAKIAYYKRRMRTAKTQEQREAAAAKMQALKKSIGVE